MMSCNIVNEYVSFSSKAIKKYLQMILKQYFDQDVYDDLINAYMNERYYNMYDKISDRFEVNIVHYLKEAINDKKDDSKYKKKARWMFGIFKYILYFDSVKECTSVRPLIKELADFRKRELNLDDNFESEFYNVLKEDLLAKKEFVNSFKDKNFNVNYTRVKRNVFNSSLESNLKFPKIYSEYAINKMFNSMEIKEQRLFVLYPLVTIKVLEDILKGNFEKQYLTDFMVNLKDKPKKFKKLLNIIDNDIAKEKICLKISYSDYSNNKENIYELTREGYRFALILDDSVNLDEELLELLSIFSYVIVTDEKLYEKLKNHYKILYITNQR